MNLKRYTVTFEASFSIDVFAPEGADAKQIQEIADDIATAYDHNGWDFPEFEAVVSRPTMVEFEPSDLVPEVKTRFGVTQNLPRAPILLRASAMCLDDAGETFVSPEEASWWALTEEQALRLQDIHHPDQTHLFASPLHGDME
jgi:hypothetical protein